MELISNYSNQFIHILLLIIHTSSHITRLKKNCDVVIENNFFLILYITIRYDIL
jgi:hypothetical protein